MGYFWNFFGITLALALRPRARSFLELWLLLAVVLLGAATRVALSGVLHRVREASKATL